MCEYISFFKSSWFLLRVDHASGGRFPDTETIENLIDIFAEKIIKNFGKNCFKGSKMLNVFSHHHQSVKLLKEPMIYIISL